MFWSLRRLRSASDYQSINHAFPLQIQKSHGRLGRVLTVRDRASLAFLSVWIPDDSFYTSAVRGSQAGLPYSCGRPRHDSRSVPLSSDASSRYAYARYGGMPSSAIKSWHRSPGSPHTDSSTHWTSIRATLSSSWSWYARVISLQKVHNIARTSLLSALWSKRWVAWEFSSPHEAWCSTRHLEWSTQKTRAPRQHSSSRTDFVSRPLLKLVSYQK